MDLSSLKKTATNWVGETGRLLVAKQAEAVFRQGVQDFCKAFTPEDIQQVALSGQPFEQVINKAVRGTKLEIKPTNEKDLNPWARYLYNLPEQRLIEILMESVPEGHVLALAAYPEVARGIIRTVKGMVQEGQ